MYHLVPNEQRINRLDSARSRRYTTRVISSRGGTIVLSENDQNTNTKTSRRSSLTHLLHTQSVAQAAVLIAVISFLSKFVGFAREVVIARQFGATGQTDAFLVGRMVPSLVLGLFAGGLGLLIVPWYLGHKRRDPERARLLVDQIALVWGIVFALVCVGVWDFAPQLVHIFASGLAGARYTLAVIGFVPLVILLASKRYGFLKRFDVRHVEWPAILQFAALLMPLVLAGGVTTLNVMVDRWVASRLPEGAIAALNFAGRV